MNRRSRHEVRKMRTFAATRIVRREHARKEAAMPPRSADSNCGASRVRWKMPAIGHLSHCCTRDDFHLQHHAESSFKACKAMRQCQVQCAMDRGCHYFHVSPDGDCATFNECSSQSASGEVFHYRTRCSAAKEVLVQSTDLATRLVALTPSRTSLLLARHSLHQPKC